MEAKNLADLYNLPPLEWAPIEARLDQSPDEGGVFPPGQGAVWRQCNRIPGALSGFAGSRETPN